jgi:hypothetical protein
MLPGNEFYWHAFQDLITDRPIGMATGSIPWSSLNEYHKRYDCGEFEKFAQIIRALDSFQLRYGKDGKS